MFVMLPLIKILRLVILATYLLRFLNYWGNGVGQFLMETMIDWADHTPTIRRLELTVQHVMNGRFISIKNLDLTLKALRNVVQELKMENF